MTKSPPQPVRFCLRCEDATSDWYKFGNSVLCRECWEQEIRNSAKPQKPNPPNKLRDEDV